MAQEHADDVLTQQIAYHQAEARKLRDELAKRKEQRREDAFAQRCLRDSKSVEQRKERDLAIIDAILDCCFCLSQSNIG